MISYASIPVVIPIVMIPMMPSVPPIFIRVTIMVIAPGVIVIRPVWLVSGANVNAKAFICLGFGRCQRNQPEPCQPQKEIFSHIIVFVGLDEMGSLFTRFLGLDQARP